MRLVLGSDRGRIPVPASAQVGDLHSLIDVGRPGHVHTEPEPVEQLRAQVTLVRVHRPDQDEPRRVGHRKPFALDDVDSRRRRVQQDIDDVIVEQVHLVDIQHVAVRAAEYTAFEPLDAGGERGLQVDGADHPVLGCVDRQLDDAHWAGGFRQRARSCLEPHPALIAHHIGLARITPELAPLNDDLVGKQRRQGADRRRLGGAAVTADQDATDRGVDRVQDERELHVLLADDRGERVCPTLQRHESISPLAGAASGAPPVAPESANDEGVLGDGCPDLNLTRA